MYMNQIQIYPDSLFWIYKYWWLPPPKKKQKNMLVEAAGENVVQYFLYLKHLKTDLKYDLI